MKKAILFFSVMFLFGNTHAEINAGLMQQPDISDTHITFIYGDDIWIVDRKGGVAHHLSTPESHETSPRFSPDGTKIAYIANYQGNFDVYVIPIEGGTPKRLTYNGSFDRVLDWTPDGKSILIASSRENGRHSYSEIYTVPLKGGPLTKLRVPYGEWLKEGYGPGANIGAVEDFEKFASVTNAAFKIWH